MAWESITTDTDLGDAPGKISGNLTLLRNRFLSSGSWPDNPVAGQSCVRSDRDFAVYTYTDDSEQGENGWVEDTALSAVFQALVAEVEDARFDAASLAAFLAVEHDADGGHKTSMGRADWIEETDTLARVGDQQFSVVGDHTSVAIVGRAVEINDAEHGHVAAASYESGTDLTTVTVMGCAVPETLSKVEWGPDPRTDGVHVGEEIELTIASGEISPPAGVVFIRVDTEGEASADDLETIDLTHVPKGWPLELRCVSAARPVTLKHGTDDIGLVGEADVVLDDPARPVRLVRIGSAMEERVQMHGHAVAEVTGLQAALDAKADEADLGTAAVVDTGTGEGDVPVLDANGLLPQTMLPEVADATARLNIALLLFRMMIEHGLSVQDMVDGFADEFEDETGIDDSASSNYLYNADEHHFTRSVTHTLESEYALSNRNDNWDMYAGNNEQIGQALDLSSGIDLSKVCVALKRYGSPTGNLYCRIYEATGTLGSSAVPTGNALAVSEPVDVSTISDSAWDWVEFTFPELPAIAAGDICVGIDFQDGGDSSNYIMFGIDTSPSHAGNAWLTDSFETAYNGQSTRDIPFQIHSGVGDAMTLITEAVTAAAQPDDGWVVALAEGGDDLAYSMSRDGGTTWTAATLEDQGISINGYVVLAGSVDLSSQPSGTDMVLKATTTGDDYVRLHAHAGQWSD